ncbi:MAG: PilZ domain-containing protein [Deltaproteobacteria bacterium]|jgi:hypothetical protein|nr:PilZ domain-containing protein [Deltaproteobacteria bacterium]
MPLNSTEQRQHSRRILKMPVTFFLKEKNCNMADYLFGWTKDVSADGTCIHAKLSHIPLVDSQLTLLVASEIQNRFTASDISVQIKGQVVWNDNENQNFGVRFI